jgi:glycosyltransferase involved in cell wall biosynthesis
VIESLYFGCPVFATPYGSLNELVGPAYGVLASECEVLAEAILSQSFDLRACHQHAVQSFNAKKMAIGYLEKYQKVADGDFLSSIHPQALERDVRLPWA